jgi:hypothetical protein
VLGILIILPMLDGGPVEPSPRSKTIGEIRKCYLLLGLDAETQSNNLERIAVAQQHWEDLPGAIVSVLYKRGSDQTRFTNSSGPFSAINLPLDSWEQPLMVSWRSNILDKASRRLLEEHFSLIIWSKGPNRSNELGSGDDIFIKRAEAVRP